MTDQQIDEIVQLRQLEDLLSCCDGLELRANGHSYKICGAVGRGALRFALAYLVYSPRTEPNA